MAVGTRSCLHPCAWTWLAIFLVGIGLGILGLLRLDKWCPALDHGLFHVQTNYSSLETGVEALVLCDDRVGSDHSLYLPVYDFFNLSVKRDTCNPPAERRFL